MKKSKINLRKLLIVTLVMAMVLILVAVVFTRDKKVPGVADVCSEQVLVSNGDTLSGLLSEQGVNGRDINNIAEILKQEAGISTLRADSDKIIFMRPTDDAPVNKIVLACGPWKQVELSCGEDGRWSAQNIDIEKDTRVVKRRGEIKDGDSFYVAGIRAGIPAGVLADVYDLLAFEMDFERDVRAGQEFSVMFEENYCDGNRVDSGKVIAVSFDALRGHVEMFRFKKSDGTSGYYDAQGNGAVKSLKRTPINNARVTSSFSSKRKHPVLGFTRAHKGVDFRAGTGTPIPSAGAGKVVKKAKDRGYGNYIKIRHNGTFETLYAHMSKFAKGVNVGTNVKQGQIIGYVGSTGLSTGPHLHYEIIKGGTHVNPMTVKFPSIDNLDSQNKKDFIKYRERLEEASKLLGSDESLFIQL